MFFGPTKELLWRVAERVVGRLRAQDNLRRFRVIAWCIGRLVLELRAATERAYTPGGIGFRQAEDSFNSQRSVP